MINRVAKSLKALYRRVVIGGLIEYRQNSCLGIDIDKPEPSNRKSPTAEEFKRLMTSVESLSARIAAVKIGLATGMRKGEVLGLTWRAVNLEAGKLSISQQFTQDKSLKEPKSKAGNRISSSRKNSVLSRSMEKRAIPHFGMRGIKQSLDTPIVNSENEEFQDPRAFSRWFRDFCVDNGFGEYKDTDVYRGNQGKYDGRRRRRKSCYEGLCFHELRHTQTTLLIGSKCDIKTVQHRPGLPLWKQRSTSTRTPLMRTTKPQPRLSQRCTSEMLYLMMVARFSYRPHHNLSQKPLCSLLRIPFFRFVLKAAPLFNHIFPFANRRCRDCEQLTGLLKRLMSLLNNFLD